MKTLLTISLFFLTLIGYSQAVYQELTLVNNATVTADAVYNQLVKDHTNWSLQVNWTDASATDGILKIRVSNNGIATNYANYASMDSVVISTASGFAIFADTELTEKWLQLSYTENSNTTIKLTVKLILKP